MTLVDTGGGYPWLVRPARSVRLTRDAVGSGSLYAAIEEAGVELYRAEEPLKPAMVRPEVATARGIELDALVQRVLFESNTYLRMSPPTASGSTVREKR